MLEIKTETKLLEKTFPFVNFIPEIYVNYIIFRVYDEIIGYNFKHKGWFNKDPYKFTFLKETIDFIIKTLQK